jgi:uncharacterized protein (UPF0371 family)
MELNLKIKLDNAAFEGKFNRDLEIEGLLNHVTEQIINGSVSRAIIDSNGNKVGQWEIKGAPDVYMDQ